MTIEGQLHEVLHALRDGELVQPPASPGTAHRVETAARAWRRRQRVAAAALVVLLAGGAFTAVRLLPGPAAGRIVPTSPGGQHGPRPSGLAWLLTPARWAAYTAAHPSPSPNPVMVPSPAPPNAALRELESDALHVLPGARVVRADSADGGQQGQLVIWLRLGNLPVVVSRNLLHYPIEAGGFLGSEHVSRPRRLATGSAVAVLSGGADGYSALGRTWSGPFVWTVTPDGWFTAWTAPVPVGEVLRWAVRSDQRFVASGG
jgi:hypothetical protein